MRKAIKDILESDPEIEIIGSAKNGQECLDMVKELRPDVITLDMDMPIMDGMTTIRHIMLETPVPIVVLSSLYTNGAITFDALRLGAVDFVPKPSGAISQDIHSEGLEIRNRIKIATSVNLENIKRVKMKEQESSAEKISRSGPPEYFIAVGTSISGPNTFIRLLSTLSPEKHASTVLVLDISPKILPAFVDKFDNEVPWKVAMAINGAELQQGTCYIHSNKSDLKIQTNETDKPCLVIGDAVDTPLDRFFSSAAETFGQKCVGVLLTGTGNDGAEGFSKIQEMQGTTIAQSIESCICPDLTGNVIDKRVADRIVSEKELSSEIENAVH